MRPVVAPLLIAALLLVARPAAAVNPDEMLSNPSLEARAREISKGLRCLVCQNESIDESNADLARDLRLLVRDRLVKGDSDGQVVGYIVSRYGDYVLLTPPLKATTALLWLAPLLLLLAGGVAMARFYLRPPVTPPAGLSPDEQQRLKALLPPEETP